jgi:hypothetical protein
MSRVLVAAMALSAIVVVGVVAARGAACRALVALGSVDLDPSPVGMSVRISGIWEFENLVQVVSALSFNVLLVRENNFVRFHHPNQAFVGSVPGLAGQVNAGIDGDDILDVEAAGTEEPAARFVSFEAQRMKLSSPLPAGEGPITVVAYLVIDGDYVSPILSNTITRSIKELAPPVTLPPPEGDGTGGESVP